MAEDGQAPPVATEGISLSCSAEYESYPLSGQQPCWAITSLKAPFYEPTSRSSVDIVAVIDKSGSMSGEKIKLVRETLLFVIDQLKDGDRMSLVTYDSHVNLEFGLIKMDKANKEKAKSFVKDIRDGSSTNLCGGLLKGMEQIAKTDGSEKAQVQSVLLLTDGLANQGITSKEGILEQVKKFQDLGAGAVNIDAGSSGRSPMRPHMQQRGIFGQFGNRGPPVPPKFQQDMQQRGIFGQFGNWGPPVPPKFQQQQQAPLPMIQQQQQGPIDFISNAAPLPPPMIQQQQQAPIDFISNAAPLPPPLPSQTPPPLPPPPPPVPVLQVIPTLNRANSDSDDDDDDDDDDDNDDDVDDSPKPKPTGSKFDGTIYTFGFGSDHDSTLLEAISTQGGGVYYYIDINEKIPESFADCLGGLLSVVGQNLSLKLEMQGGNSITTIHANRAINWTTPNMSCEVVLGDLQSEEERDIVLEIKLSPVDTPQQDLVLKTTLSYFNIIASTLDTVTFDLVIDRKDGNQGPAKEAVDVQRNRILATTALKKAEPLADEGKLEDAQAVLKEAIALLEGSATATQDFCLALISDLKKSLESMKTKKTYLGHGKLYMHSKAQAHSVQRSNFVDETCCYENMSKMVMRSKAKK